MKNNINSDYTDSIKSVEFEIGRKSSSSLLGRFGRLPSLNNHIRPTIFYQTQKDISFKKLADERRRKRQTFCVGFGGKFFGFGGSSLANDWLNPTYQKPVIQPYRLKVKNLKVQSDKKNVQSDASSEYYTQRMKRHAFGGGMGGGFAGYGGSPLANNYGGWANPTFQKRSKSKTKEHDKREIKQLSESKTSETHKVNSQKVYKPNIDLMFLSNFHF